MLKIKNKSADEMTMFSLIVVFLLETLELVFQVPILSQIDVPLIGEAIQTKDFAKLIPFVFPLWAVVQRIAAKLVETGFSISQVWSRISTSQNFYFKAITIVFGLFTVYGLAFPDNAIQEVSEALSTGDWIKAITVFAITFLNYNIIKKQNTIAQ